MKDFKKQIEIIQLKNFKKNTKHNATDHKLVQYK